MSEAAALLLNGQSLPADSGHNFSHATTLQEGSNRFTLVATDLAGNKTTLIRTVVLDMVVPESSVVGQINISPPNANGKVTVTGEIGSVEAGTTVVITNTRTGERVTTPADGQGAFTTQIAAAQGDILSLGAKDAAGNTSAPVEKTISGGGGNVPPDPSDVAPPLPETGFPPLADRVGFLYSGSQPIQRNVAPGALVEKRVSVISGKVMDTRGNPLPGVKITVLHHPEFGHTYTQASGEFDLAVNGGGQFALVYRVEGYLPVQRTLSDTQWHGWYHVDEVVMMPLSPKVTPIDLTSNAPIQVARGPAEADAAGPRQATLFFPQGTAATMTLPDGTQQPLNRLDVRLTEYTVGPDGPQAMPAKLPANVAYTYAIELSVDQALAQNAEKVTFSQPVPFYVENFLEFPVGEAVPVGYYDQSKAAWIPYPNGRIIGILAEQGGLAVLDVTGSGNPATAAELAALGITEAERAKLAELYAPGDSLRRVALSHFSTWDCNWPYGPPQDAKPPEVDLPDTALNRQKKHGQDTYEDDRCPGCDINVQRQSVGESIPVAGTPFSLRYQSVRAKGAKVPRTIKSLSH